MSLLEKATLITTPTAHSNGKLHSIKGGTDADFDVVRGSAATRVNAEGLIESVATDIPRIDYTTGEGVILTEPQSTNEVEYSNDIANSYWDKLSSGNGSAPIVTSNYAISPDGTQNATRIQFDASTNGTSSDRSRIRAGLTLVDGVDYTFSFYAKSTDGTDQKIAVLFDNSVVVAGRFTIGSEWQRFEYTATQTGTSSLCGLDLRSNNAFTSDILVYGIQVEALTYATSYIPTSGAIATRFADIITGAGSTDLINSEEGVLYAEIAALANDGTNRYITLSDGTSTNDVRMYFNATSGLISALIKVGGNTQAFLSTSAYAQTDFNKIAFKYKENNFALWVNGVELDTDSIGNTFASGTLTKLNFYRGSIVNPLFSKTKTVAVFSEALSDEELTCLTTI